MNDEFLLKSIQNPSVLLSVISFPLIFSISLCFITFYDHLFSLFLAVSLVDNTSMLSCLRPFVPSCFRIFVPSSIGVSLRSPIRLSIRSFLRSLRPFVPLWLGPLHLWSFRIYSSSIISNNFIFFGWLPVVQAIWSKCALAVRSTHADKPFGWRTYLGRS